MPTTGGQIQRERSVDSQIDTQIALVQEPQKRKSDWQVTTMISAWMADCLLLGRVWADICSQRDVSMVLLYSRTEQSRRASLAGLWSWGESWGVAGTIIETVLAITSTTFVIPKSFSPSPLFAKVVLSSLHSDSVLSASFHPHLRTKSTVQRPDWHLISMN